MKNEGKRKEKKEIKGGTNKSATSKEGGYPGGGVGEEGNFTLTKERWGE